jgi:hypothetical protein
MGAIFRIIPLLIFPMILYAAVALTMDHAVVHASMSPSSPPRCRAGRCSW